MGPNTQGPQDHIELEVEKYSLHMPSKVHLEGPSGDHPQTQLPEDLGKHSHPHPGQRMITVQAVPTLEKPLPAPYHVTEGTRGELWEKPQLADIQKPSEAPLAGQEDKPPSQVPTYKSVSRIQHSESVVEADKGSLEPSPSPAVFLHEPQEESGGQASPGTCSSETVMDLKECSQASRGQEVMDRDATWKGTFEPSLLIKYQIVNIDMRRSWCPRSHKNPSSNTKFVATNPEDVYFDEQCHKLKFQGFTDWQKQAEARPLACCSSTLCH